MFKDELQNMYQEELNKLQTSEEVMKIKIDEMHV